MLDCFGDARTEKAGTCPTVLTATVDDLKGASSTSASVDCKISDGVNQVGKVDRKMKRGISLRSASDGSGEKKRGKQANKVNATPN